VPSSHHDRLEVMPEGRREQLMIAPALWDVGTGVRKRLPRGREQRDDGSES
jgi:hypothetical protein